MGKSRGSQPDTQLYILEQLKLLDGFEGEPHVECFVYSKQEVTKT